MCQQYLPVAASETIPAESQPPVPAVKSKSEFPAPGAARASSSLMLEQLAVRQHNEVISRLDVAVQGIKALQLIPLTAIYLLSVAYFFYIGRISEWIWVVMTIYPLTPLYGDTFLKTLFGFLKKRGE